MIVVPKSSVDCYLTSTSFFALRMARSFAFRFTSEGFSYRSRLRSSRFIPLRSYNFRNRRTAS